MKMTASTGILACMTGAYEPSGANAIFRAELSRSSRSCRATCEISRSPRLAHKAPVMQATGILAFKIGPVHMYQFLFENE